MLFSVYSCFALGLLSISKKNITGAHKPCQVSSSLCYYDFIMNILMTHICHFLFLTRMTETPISDSQAVKDFYFENKLSY